MTLVHLLIGAWLLVGLAPLLVRVLRHNAGWPLAAGMLALAGMAVYLGRDGTASDVVPWLPSIDVSLRLRMDGLGLLFTLLVLVVGAVVMAYSTDYFRGKPTADYYALMTAFAAAMTTLVLADDLVVLFISWELTTLCSYLLILRSGPTAGPPATRTLLITVAGGLALLAAVCTIVVHTGTTQLSTALAHPAWGADPTFAAVVAALIAMAAATKAAQFPFHSWLPDAMVAPAPVSAYLHAAAMVKAGIFLLLRFADATSHSPWWPAILITIGGITSVIGAVFALQRTDLKGLLAYSTVSHLGLLTLVIGVGTPEAMVAALVHVVAHAAFKSSGFMYVGLLEKRAGTREIHEVSGLWRSMRLTSLMLVFAVVAMAGVPPTLGFISKELILDSLVEGPGLLLAVFIALSAVLTVAYCGRMVVYTLPGEPTPLAPVTGTRAMALGVGLPALLALGFGLVPGTLDTLIGSASVAVGGDDGVYLSLWHGVNAALVLSISVLALGALAVLAREPISRLLDRKLFPVTGVQVVDALQAEMLNLGRLTGDLTRTDKPAPHLATPLVFLTAVGAAILATGGASWTGTFVGGWLDILLLVFILVGVLAACLARSSLSAIISVGVAGFTVALWFYVLGAADVALTQLLVEILTVVVVVLVLRHLPHSFAPESAAHHYGKILVAVGAGVIATVATVALTGREELSAAGRWYIENVYDETGGTNLVNTILVDFRPLDTFGELVVLALAAVSITALLQSRPMITAPVATPRNTLLVSSDANAVFLSVLSTVLVPLMFFGSAYALLRGHDMPGGGFIAALIGAAALALNYLAATTDHAARSRLPHLPIAALGVLVAVVAGLFGFVDGSFLTPIPMEILGYKFSSALVFDLGVYFAVFGVILGALTMLGTPAPPDGPLAGEVPAPAKAPGTVTPGTGAATPDEPQGEEVRS